MIKKLRLLQKHDLKVSKLKYNFVSGEDIGNPEELKNKKLESLIIFSSKMLKIFAEKQILENNWGDKSPKSTLLATSFLDFVPQ